MTRRHTAFLLLALAPAILASHGRAARSTASSWTPPVAVVQTDSAFARTIARLSEPGGYFDSDNLISNEASYLHVLGALRDVGTTGGAYLGVGPDQNFTYIAHVRPSIAYLIDIRRDNLLQHLLYKALFAHARSRIEYLALLTGRAVPADANRWRDRSIAELVEYIDGQPVSSERHLATAAQLRATIRSFGVPLSADDMRTIERIHRAFVDDGLGLTFTSHGRGPRPYYPTFRRLLVETDRTGRHANFLADDAAFRVVKTLHESNRIIPVVGDLAGDHALQAIAADIAARGERVSAFYTSNVEYYLMADRSFDRFVRNLRTLPRDDRSVIIRSYFSRGYPHPQSVPGYYSTQLLERLDVMLRAYDTGRLPTYFDLLNRGG
jgi:hypothetical protein